MTSTLFYSVEIDIVCIVVFICVISNIWKSGDRARFSYILVLALVTLQALSDIFLKTYTSFSCYALFDKNEVCTKDVTQLVIFSCMVSFFNLLVPYVFFVISYLIKAEKSRTKDIKLCMLSIPFVILCYLVLTSPANGYIQFLTYHGAYVHGKYYSALVGTVGFYSILALINFMYVVASRQDRMIEFSISKVDYILFYLTCTLPFILAPVNLLVDEVLLVSPLFAVCFFFLMTLHQHMRISIDDLTTLNNRNELKSFLLNLVSLSEAERKTTYMMFIDVNKFKSINDNYGHNEGDVVLMQLSRLLKVVAETFNCFLCRYGGDEFILIKKNANEERAAGVCRFIDKTVARLKILSLAPYELSVSTGYVRFDNRFKTAKDFIEAADRLMYETKRSTRKDYSKI